MGVGVEVEVEIEGHDGMDADTLNRISKKGLWSLKKFETPGDYKKRMKAAEDGLVGVRATVRQETAKGIWGVLRRFFTRPL